MTLKKSNTKENKLRKTVQLILSGEIYETIKLCSNYLPDRLIRINKSDFLMFKKEKIEIMRKPTNYEFRKARIEDLYKIIDCSEHTENVIIKNIFQKYFSEGRKCYYIEVENKIVGYIWAFKNFFYVSYDDYNKINIKFKFRNNAVLFGDGFIKPMYRLRGYFPVLLGEMMNDLKKENASNTFWAIVGSFNKHSLKSHLRLGFEISNVLYFISILNLQFVILVANSKKRFYKLNKRTTIVI